MIEATGLRDNVTVSDEAFARLCVENYMECCKNKYENTSQANESEKKVVASGKWTLNGNKAKKNGGWSQEGIRRYNELLKWIKNDRDQHKAQEDEYVERKKGEGKKGQKRKREQEQKDKENEDHVEPDFVDYD